MSESLSLAKAWDQSYARLENHTFVPSDEAVRFFARYLRKRTGPQSFVDIDSSIARARIIDVGCGIGRNLVYGSQLGLEMWGIDLSHQAIQVAREIVAACALGMDPERQILQADVTELPWPASFFRHAVCDSALDSMPFSTAQRGIREIARVLEPGGLLWCSLIESDNLHGPSKHGGDWPSEIEIDVPFEFGTIQSFFNYDKIRSLLGSDFQVLSCTLHQVLDPNQVPLGGRWSVTCERLQH